MCYFPFEINGIKVPCGHCYQCVQSFRSEWMFRNLIEMQYHKNAYFVTLTYSPEAIELLPFDCYSDIRLQKTTHRTSFLKTLRKYISCRYYGCFEYGDVNFRPHYHFIIYTDNTMDFELLDRCWSFGRTKLEVSQKAAIHYVSAYLQKPFRKYNNKREYINYIYDKCDPRNLVSNRNLTIFEQTKRYMSTHPALGYQLLEDKPLCNYIRNYALTHSQYPQLTFNGKSYKLPRYYIKKLFTDDERKLIFEDGSYASELKLRQTLAERQISLAQRVAELSYVNDLKFKQIKLKQNETF